MVLFQVANWLHQAVFANLYWSLKNLLWVEHALHAVVMLHRSAWVLLHRAAAGICRHSEESPHVRW